MTTEPISGPTHPTGGNRMSREIDVKEYKKKQAACKCLSEKRRAYIQTALDVCDDWPDGAFFAYLEERNIDVTELEPFSLEHNCTPIPEMRGERE